MSDRKTILITLPRGQVKDTFLPKDALDRLAARFDLIENETERQFSPEELSARLRDADAVITGWGTSEITENALQNNTRLRLIAHTGGSVADLVDASTYAHGVRVISGNRLYAESVAEGTLAYLLAALRRLPDWVFGMRGSGLWRSEDDRPDRGLFDREIGIVGYGMISKDLMRMLKPFRCRFKIYSSHPIEKEFLDEVGGVQVSLEEVFKAEIVSLHSALTPRSRGSIGKALFARLPENAVFVNTSRGAILKEDEIAGVLAERRDITAVLDVFEKEPLPAASPLRALPNVYLIPHRAGPTIDRRAYVGRELAEDILAFFDGKPMKHEIAADYAARMTRHKV